MIKRFKNYIEQEPWDEEIMRQERIFNVFAIVIIILAVLYFGPVCLDMLMRGEAAQ